MTAAEPRHDPFVQPADETRLATFTVTIHRTRDDQGVKFWRVTVDATVYTYIAWDGVNPAGALAEDAVAHAVRDHLLGVVPVASLGHRAGPR